METRFRSALNGFNREDVVNYIEYMTNRNNQKLHQMEEQNQSLHQQLEQAQACAGQDAKAEIAALTAQREALLERVAALEAELNQAKEAVRVEEAAAAPATPSELELEAYRRAERAEREAKERARAVYDQADTAIREAGKKLTSASEAVQTLSGQVFAQVNQLLSAVDESRKVLTDTVSGLKGLTDGKTE